MIAIIKVYDENLDIVYCLKYKTYMSQIFSKNTIMDKYFLPRTEVTKVRAP